MVELRTALICIAKRENRYIREWCEHHKKIGFDDIYIYDNNEKYEERIADAVGDLPYVHINTKYRGVQQKCVEIQLKCYNEWYAGYNDKYSHFAFLDCDEFLHLSDKYADLKEYIRRVGFYANAIKIFWKCYGDDGRLKYENKPLKERFTKVCEPKDGKYFYKMIYSFKHDEFKMINVHYSVPLPYIVDCNGARIKYTQSTYSREPMFGDAWIDHYITKSTEEFFTNKRGKKDDAKRLTVNFYYNYNERTPEKDELISKILGNDYKPEAASVKAVSVQTPQHEYKPQTPLLPKPTATQPTQIQSDVYPEGVSVCISAYQTQDYIEECLDSVEAQTWFKSHSNWEVLLGIDGCEKTLEKVRDIMHKYRNLRVFMMDRNVGTYVTCNTIMKQAKYKWLLRFDSDDVMFPNMVEELLKYTRKDAEMVIPYAKNFGTTNNNIGTAHGSMLMLHSTFEKFGGFKPWKCAADTELKKRLQKVTRQMECPEILFKRRTHRNSLTNKAETNMLSPLRRKYHSQIRTTTTVAGATIKTVTVPFNEISPFIIDKITYTETLKCKNKTHILIVDYKQLEYTKQILEDIVEQDVPFDLTIFEQECDKETVEYIDGLKSKWTLNDCELNIVYNEVNAPLNHIWNWFYENATNQYLAILNNDIRICDNFVSDAEKIFEKENMCGIIVHPTNRSKFTKQTRLVYEASDEKPLLQGWDYIIKRDIYKPIPQELWVYGGDNYIFAEVLKCGQKIFYDISSPIIHYRSSTIKNVRNNIKDILMNDSNIVKKLQINKYLSHQLDNKFTKRDFAGFYQLDKTIKICYTAITGDYDTLNEPSVVTKGWRYICFTNNPNIKSSIWEILPIPAELTKLSNVKSQRMLKICPHRYLQKYDKCIWVDGNITIQCDLNKFVSKKCNGDFCITRHPQRNCIYDECNAVVGCKKDTQQHTDEIKAKLESEGFPHNFGLAETGLMYRKNTDSVKRICEEWGNQILSNKTHRDQLTFNYVLWKLGISVEYLPSDIVRNGKLFKLNPHKK